MATPVILREDTRQHPYNGHIFSHLQGLGYIACGFILVFTSWFSRVSLVS
jgi:hypothetical protein